MPSSRSRAATLLASTLLVPVFSYRSEAQIFSVLHPFTLTEGSHINSTPIEVSPGVFYGTAGGGGANSCGTRYSIAASGVFTKLHDFSAVVDGCGPVGRLVHASKGYLYNATSAGYPGQFGTIYHSDLARNVTVLQTIPTNSVALIVNPPIEAVDGYLYGTVGHNPNGSYFYKMSLDGEVIFQTSIPSVLGPYVGPLIIALTATSMDRSTEASFRGTPTGDFRVIHSFAPENNGSSNSLVQAADGKLYGTHGGFYGALYSLNLDGSGFLQTALKCPTLSSGITAAADGHLYFSSYYCGSSNDGQLYRADPGSGTVQIVHEFGGNATNPETPSQAVLQASKGLFFGTASLGNRASGSLYTIDLGLRSPSPSTPIFNPASGAEGAAVLIRGGHLLQTSAVTLNGTPAPYTVDSSDFLTVTVPAGATSGPITVTTPYGSTSSVISVRIP